MPTNYDDVEAQCPFFKESDRRSISCEGVGDSCVLRMSYNTIAERNLQRNLFCNDIRGCKRCEIYQMVMGKYEY